MDEFARPESRRSIDRIVQGKASVILWKVEGLAMPIDDFVREREGDVTSGHPLLRFVQSRKRAGDTVEFELRQPPEQIGYRKASICLHCIRDGEEVDYKQDGWDDDLNTALVRMGVRSVSSEAEMDRFALGLRAAFRKPERRVGDGYFNAVLVEFVKESDFGPLPDVARLLQHIPVNRPDRGRSYDDCRQMTEDAIRDRGIELTKDLGYPVDRAIAILSGALVRYLDERFSISSRKLLGLL
jgi:hypothetical protein